MRVSPLQGGTLCKCCPAAGRYSVYINCGVPRAVNCLLNVMSLLAVSGCQHCCVVCLSVVSLIGDKVYVVLFGGTVLKSRYCEVAEKYNVKVLCRCLDVPASECCVVVGGSWQCLSVVCLLGGIVS